MPNQSVLVAALSLQEAKDSSEIENIITSQDELYRSDDSSKNFTRLEAKEMPTIPICFGSVCFSKGEHLKNVYVSPLFNVDFSQAYFVEEDQARSFQ